MKIKTIYDVVPYLDMFYFMANNDLKSQPPYKDKHGSEYKIYSAVVDERLFKNPEKTLAKMMVSHFMSEIHNTNLLYEYANKDKTHWVIEWRTKPEYEKSNEYFYAKSYARYSIYPREKNG